MQISLCLFYLDMLNHGVTECPWLNTFLKQKQITDALHESRMIEAGNVCQETKSIEI